MIRLILLAIALVVFVSIAVTLILSALIFLAFACLVGVPLYIVGKHWLNGHGVNLAMRKQSPMERLQNLYVEGKIDLFEFERRVANLIAVEHY